MSTPAVDATSRVQGPAATTTQSASIVSLDVVTPRTWWSSIAKPMAGVPSRIAAPRTRPLEQGLARIAAV